MSDQIQAGMAEATRLTRQGRLAEATAVIQRTMGGNFSPTASSDGLSSTDEPMEATFHVVDRASRAKAPSRPGPTNKHALRRTPRPSRRFRGAPRRTGDLPGDVSGATVGVPTPATVSTGGRFIEGSYTNRAGTRAYKLYIPSGYVGQEVPLVVMLHGCTQTPDDLAAGTLMNALAETHTFLVAYPVQAAAANSSRCWNWFKDVDQQRGRGEPSIIAGITCEVLGEYRVDPGRVYVAGMSAGGAMAAIMGEAYPDLYAAIGVHSGLAPGAAHDLPSAFAAMRQGGQVTVRRDSPAEESARIVPAIVFHGDRDTTVHPDNAERLLAHYYPAGEAPRVTARRGQVPGGYAYTCATHRDAGGRAIVERWTVHGLGHAWSGGSLPGSYTDPKGPDASAEMVRFFQQHPQQGSSGRPSD
ncbi:MAG: PHB depolymerase family esterase [Actinobacteria bacterium]|nr:PHB depolymerase family esterase [Actinomycetota bacterium]